eukprot:TRINITY_DN5414_c0_g1_i4.p1 TRINITY_DN5414_c0_g1~~TRINITY_DN5414_c0_g1_i4.p1  ORF type:complete len:264 (-),score=51.56 TRINITY_DN5414_c0_g1_i4:43-834(-)
MFESLNVPALYVALQPVLSLYASGYATGVVIESGDGVTHAVPLFEGCALEHAIARLEIGGRSLTDYLMKMLIDRGYSINTSGTEDSDSPWNKRESVRGIKEILCFVSQDFKKDFSNPTSYTKNYQWSENQSITIDKERFLCPESLFQPPLWGVQSPGIHELVFKSIMNCDVDIRNLLFENIVLSGGSTMFPGYVDRFKKELISLTPQNTKVNIIAPNNRQNSVWSGGSLLASSPSLQQMWVSSDEYDELGPAVVYRKCFFSYS